jgi:hypothetical protein
MTEQHRKSRSIVVGRSRSIVSVKIYHEVQNRLKSPRGSWPNLTSQHDPLKCAPHRIVTAVRTPCEVLVRAHISKHEAAKRMGNPQICTLYLLKIHWGSRKTNRIESRYYTFYSNGWNGQKPYPILPSSGPALKVPGLVAA